MGSFHTMTTHGRSGIATSSPDGRSTSTGAVVQGPALLVVVHASDLTAVRTDLRPPGAVVGPMPAHVPNHSGQQGDRREGESALGAQRVVVHRKIGVGTGERILERPGQLARRGGTGTSRIVPGRGPVRLGTGCREGLLSAAI